MQVREPSCENNDARAWNSMSMDLEALKAAAADPETPSNRLLELLQHPEREVRRALLDNPRTYGSSLGIDFTNTLIHEFGDEIMCSPLFVLHALVEPNEELVWIMRSVLERTNDVDLIERLFSTWGSSSEEIRCAAAKNPNTPHPILWTLGDKATEKKLKVRLNVAENKSTPPELLCILGTHLSEGDVAIRAGVAKNTNTPVDQLRIMGDRRTEGEPMVRKIVMENPRTPDHVLIKSSDPCHEPSKRVRDAASEILALRGLL